ncbi:prepilin-type N-terminal cleavage/methylation domain-containing protein [Patescibacteria group bacterium]|nr:prepilin-type N-terminal cleavage/methylation domain-containing protein [Patescibacteria group bacterium]
MDKYRSYHSRAYTLIELLISLAIMAIIGVLAFYGIQDFNVNQAVSDAQHNFISDLRATQNQAALGADGVNFKTVWVNTGSPDQYTISYTVPLSNNLVSVTKILPTGVTVSAPNPANFTVCLANPKLTGYTTGQCGNCAVAGSEAFFACNNGTKVDSNYLDVTFSRGSVSKTVRIEGNGMDISRIYALD